MGIITKIFGSKEQRLKERIKENEAFFSKSLDHLDKSVKREEVILKRLGQIDKELNGEINKNYDGQKPFAEGNNGTVTHTINPKKINELIIEGRKLIDELRTMRILPKDEIDKLNDEILGIHDAADLLFGKQN